MAYHLLTNCRSIAFNCISLPTKAERFTLPFWVRSALSINSSCVYPGVLQEAVPQVPLCSSYSRCFERGGGADLESRRNPLYGEWTLHPQVMHQIWQRYGQAAIGLLNSQEGSIEVQPDLIKGVSSSAFLFRSLCPVLALQVYFDRTAAFRKGDQLFVS